ncbi:MAG TPA: succinylglutamate desuccinylase [Chlorobaculum parvum]|uniref:Succinylglutamate desuccinylase n=1 Tax=Chlorobaculum parvum TaxID=274539 RepID=A0A7C5HN03_9CHLB|nr:succinylglutamate desuccinylase [Chlorobaculum parvum]
MELVSTTQPPKLHHFDRLPAGLANVSLDRLGTILPGPSLIRIAGEPGPPLFVSVLLHGNETTGFLAMQRIISEYGAPEQPLPRPVLLFVGNVAAAAQGMRKLDGQADYNRIWQGDRHPEHLLAQKVLAEVRKAAPLAGIDLHNNTGKNPHYGCVNRLDCASLSLARRFSRIIVWFTEPHEVLSLAMSHICPTVTLECGVSGDATGTNHVKNYLRHCLELPEETLFSPPPNHLNEIYHTTARITVPENLCIGFDPCEDGQDISFREDLELLNFEPVPAGTELGRYASAAPALQVIDDHNRDVTERYLSFTDGRILTRVPMTPSMFTSDTRIIKQDCLGYVMETYRGKEDF